MAKKSDFNTSRSVKDLQAEYGKMPPQAVDLEEAVLGALMLERDAFSIVGDLLEPDAFYKDAHQKIFRAIHKLFLNDDPVDLLTVSEALKQSGELEQVGGYYYLSQLTTRVASAAHIEFHAKIIVQKYLQRKLIGVCTELQEMAYDEATDVSDLMDKAQKAVFDIADSGRRCSGRTFSTRYGALSPHQRRSDNRYSGCCRKAGRDQWTSFGL